MNQMVSSKGALIALVVAAAAAGGLIWWQMQTVGEYTDSTSSQDNKVLTEWQTYTNEEYGFSLKYPSKFTPLVEDPDFNNFVSFRSEDGDELYVDSGQNQKGYKDFGNRKRASINGYDIYFVKEGDGLAFENLATVVHKADQNIYDDISVSIYYGGSTQEDFNTLNAIADSVKFAQEESESQSQISNVYRNTNYGYQIELPDGWVYRDFNGGQNPYVIFVSPKEVAELEALEQCQRKSPNEYCGTFGPGKGVTFTQTPYVMEHMFGTETINDVTWDVIGSTNAWLGILSYQNFLNGQWYVFWTGEGEQPDPSSFTEIEQILKGFQLIY